MGNHLLFWFCCCLVLQPLQSVADLSVGLTIQHDATTRQYDLYVPDQGGSGVLPLVLDLHGYNGSGALHRFGSGMVELAETEQFAVAFPYGLQSRWNPEFGAAGTDDVGFLVALVNHIKGQYNIDPNRVYATGFSQGGVMVYRLACEASDVFAAVVTIAGGVVQGSESKCQGQRSVPTLSFRGVDDQVVPYNGGQVAIVMPTISVLSTTSTLEFWRQENACSGPLVRESLGAESFCDNDLNCPGNAIVSMCTVRGTIGPQFHSLYSNVDNIDIASYSWAFLKAHSLQDSVVDFQINAGISDAWFFPDTAGQGFFIVVFPVIEQIFMAWFTYDTERPSADVIASLGEPGHRWLTAQGTYAGHQAVLEIFQTSGGVFDSPTPVPGSKPDGSILLEFTGCNQGTLTYDIPSVDRQNEIAIERVALDNVALCEELNVKRPPGR